MKKIIVALCVLSLMIFATGCQSKTTEVEPTPAPDAAVETTDEAVGE